jgi:hypothetical protein
MGRSIFRQETQIRKSDTYDDTVTPSLANYETTPADIEDDLNSLRSAVNNILNRSGASFPSDNWYDDLTQPTTLENGTIRGVDAINAALHLVEKKRVLRDVYDPGNDVTVTASQNWEVLALAELPTNTTAAIGSVTTLGTVAAFHGGTFDTHALSEVSGTNALNPKNLCVITDATSGDPILSGGRTIYALFQTESNTDGSTMTGTTPNRAQLSFVRPNATFDDLEACPVADIEGKTINYATRERVRLEDLTEQDFLKGAVVDVPAGSTPTRQTVYDNQGATPVDLTTNAILDLEGAGLEWQIRDDLEAILFRIIEGSAGGTSKVAIEDDVDEFDVDAVVSDFLNGIKVDTGTAGTTIDIGVTAANAITSGGSLLVQSAAANDLRLLGAQEMFLDDGNQTGSSWAQTDGIKLSDTTAEWDNFETAFGEVSLLNAIVQAYNSSHRRRVFSVVTVASILANTDVSGPSDDNNLDTDLGDLSGGTFVDDYDVYLNGQLLRPGADAAANNDYYPGTSLANGQLKFEFVLKINDQLCVVDHVA